jgi:acetylornithine deacetylase
LSGAPFAGRFILAICTAGETGRHNAVECLLGHLSAPPDMAILGIGTTGRMALGNKGRIDIEILVRGTACHSSTPWLGQNALLGAHAVIARLLPLAKRGEVHAELGPATLVATSIRSWPEATHTIQDEVKIVYDCRLLPGDTPEPALAEVRAKLRGINDVHIEVRPAAFQYPALIDAEGRLARLARLASADVDAQPLETFYSHGALDAGFLVHLGCEAAMWGPGDTALWHSDEEMVLVSDLIKGRDRYLSFLRHALA